MFTARSNGINLPYSLEKYKKERKKDYISRKYTHQFIFLFFVLNTLPVVLEIGFQTRTGSKQ